MLGSSIFKEDAYKDFDFKKLSINDALKMAIDAEKDSILYFRSMQEISSGDTKKMFEEISVEEKKHLIKLQNYNKKI